MTTLLDTSGFDNGPIADVDDGDDLGLSEADRAVIETLLSELRERDQEALKLYRPLPFQERYHASRVPQVIMAKANHTGGPQPLDEPVLTPTGWSSMGQLEVGDQVIGGDGRPCRVTGIYEQGWLPVFEVTFDDGASTRCSEDHYWKCKLYKSERFGKGRDDKWGVYSLWQIRRQGGDDPVAHHRAAIPISVVDTPEWPVPIEPYTLGVLLGDGSIAHGAMSFTTGDAEIADEVAACCGAEYQVVAAGSDGITHRINRAAGLPRHRADGTFVAHPMREAIVALGLEGARSPDKFIPEEYLTNSVSVRLALLQGLMDTDGYCGKQAECDFATCSPQLAEDVVRLVRSLGGKAKVKWRETFITYMAGRKKGRPSQADRDANVPTYKKACLNMATVRVIMPKMCPFRLSRKAQRWAARQNRDSHLRFLKTVRPAGNAKCRCISVDSPDHTYVTKDFIVTHNTICGCVEDSRALMGCDPHDKYPKKDGVLLLIGFGENHIGRVFHKYLLRPGAFDIIRDEKTGLWRTYRPWPKDKILAGHPGDLHREADKLPAPPLIPERFVKEIVWEKKAARIFSEIRLTTGWSAYAMNSAGDYGQNQGIRVHGIHIDEDLATGGWMPELVGRMSPGCLLRWTAVPQLRTDDMVLLLNQADMEEGDPHRIAEKIHVTIYDNPYLDEETREIKIRAWKAQGEDVYRKRALGELTQDTVLMYPTFSESVHDAIKFLSKSQQAEEEAGAVPRHPVQRIMTERMGNPPPDWTRYVTFDPGFTVAGALFWAVPPPDLGDFRIVYDELHITQCTAAKWGDAMEIKCRGADFQDFIIDAHGGALRDLASGVLPRRQYEQQLKNRGIRSITRGAAFKNGIDDIKGREMALRSWLDVRADGYPKLLVVARKCPHLCRTMKSFRKKTVRMQGKDIAIDEANRRGDVHLAECCEYGAADGLPYIKPPTRVREDTIVDRILRQRARSAQRRRMQLGGDPHITLGPTGA